MKTAFVIFIQSHFVLSRSFIRVERSRFISPVPKSIADFEIFEYSGAEVKLGFHIVVLSDGEAS